MADALDRKPSSERAVPRHGEGWDYRASDGVVVSMRGIPSLYQNAFLRILTSTRSYYRSLFGARCLGFIEMNARCVPDGELRLWTNGADRIYLTIRDERDLRTPHEGGPRYLHGLPHELAHIVLYRSLINISELWPGWGEGWAVYAASFLAVPYLFRKHGGPLWPRPYNYLETEGPAQLLRRISCPADFRDDALLEPITAFHRLDAKLGRRHFSLRMRCLLHKPMKAAVFRDEILALDGHANRRGGPSGRPGRRARDGAQRQAEEPDSRPA